MAKFIESKCTPIDSISKIARTVGGVETSKWSDIHGFLKDILASYPVVASFDVTKLIPQITDFLKEISLGSVIERHLDVLYSPEWKQKLLLNKAALLAMVTMANKLSWEASEIRKLIVLGILKDIGYSRLNEQVRDFEILHPLVSYQIVDECNKNESDSKNCVGTDILNSIITHHEFVDASGSLSKMMHS